ncbi:hypothetical protein [Desulfurivibrio sp. C05AmB]|uniref:hypothetical protein n=1 Tax=Desulfurivibrio sp. C05AmB TaxID=3374371 RepID=UPI00376EA19B
MVANNVVCMKWGKVYGPEYVNILYRMVRRNLTVPFRFVCLTDDPAGLDPGIETMPIPSFPEPSPEHYRKCQAWRKLLLFAKPFADLEGKIFFLDLDVVIVGNLDVFFAYSDKLAIIENWSQPNRLIGQASAICFPVGAYHHLLDNYLADRNGIAAKFETEQKYITRALGKDNFAYFPDEWCRSFKMHCLPGGILNSFIAPTGIPAKARVIVFHGNPNPPDALAGVWGKPVPWYKRFYKTLKPTPWIAEYWR